MTDRLAPWKSKIRARRETTPFRDFVREIASWCPVSFHSVDGRVSRYPASDRVGRLVDGRAYADRDNADFPGLDYRPDVSFFDAWAELHRSVPLPLLWDFGNTENCAYSDTVGYGCKNVYLTNTAGLDVENVLYSFFVVDHCADVLGSVGVTDGCANIYSSSGIARSYQIFYSRSVSDSSDIWYSANLQGCRECVACHDLANQSYCIENIAYPKEEYLARKQAYLDAVADPDARYTALAAHPSANPGSAGSTGRHLVDCTDVENGLYVHGVHRGRNLLLVGNGQAIEDCYDNVCSATVFERGYACMGCSPGTDMYCSINSWEVSDCFYSMYCSDCHHIIGCIGLRHASYMIFNKQYSEDEWHRLADEIFAGLEARGELGAFFPGHLNPFYFNETMAAMTLDWEREDTVSRGYLWRDGESRVDVPAGAEIVDVRTLDARTYDESILKKVLHDGRGKYYRIVPMEYAFLRKYHLPLPTTHWWDRMRAWLRFA